jgi:hypothetical protein
MCLPAQTPTAPRVEAAAVSPTLALHSAAHTCGLGGVVSLVVSLVEPTCGLGGLVEGAAVSPTLA